MPVGVGTGETLLTGKRRILAAGHTVVEVIKNYHRKVDVAPGGMNQMVAAYCGYIPVSGKNKCRKRGVSYFNTRSKRYGPAMSGMQGIEIDITYSS